MFILELTFCVGLRVGVVRDEIVDPVSRLDCWWRFRTSVRVTKVPRVYSLNSREWFVYSAPCDSLHWP